MLDLFSSNGVGGRGHIFFIHTYVQVCIDHHAMVWLVATNKNVVVTTTTNNILFTNLQRKRRVPLPAAWTLAVPNP